MLTAQGESLYSLQENVLVSVHEGKKQRITTLKIRRGNRDNLWKISRIFPLTRML